MLFIVYELFSLAPKGSPSTSLDTDALRLNSALLTVKSIVVSAVAEVPAVSTAAATRIIVFGSTYSYVVPVRTWSDVAPAARKIRFFTKGMFNLLIFDQLYSFFHWCSCCSASWCWFADTMVHVYNTLHSSQCGLSFSDSRFCNYRSVISETLS